MNDLNGVLGLLLTMGIVLAAAYLPGYAAVRLLGGSRLLSLGAAPALGAALAGIAALIAPCVGVDWSLLPFLAGAVVMLGAAWGLSRIGVRLPSTDLDGPLMPRRTVPWAPLWLAGAVAVAVVPVAAQARRPDAVLERWDTLYHLSALQRIRETGTASSLDLGSVSNTAGDPTAYPAGFHALASLVPGVSVPIVLNGATAALAFLPWVLGIALLARAVYPRIPWAPFAAALVAALIPASPLNLWVHLSPVPNLSGFATLPGALAAVVALWGALLPQLAGSAGAAQDSSRRLGFAATALVITVAGVGLGLLHPNVAVMALLLVAVFTAVTGLPRWRSHPGLITVPVAAMIPVLILQFTPLGSGVTDFVGGLQVPWWTALGEVLLGLHTVWPMALGTIIAGLWWPGLVGTFRSPERWIGVAWILVAILYLDAAVDSPLNLSTLFYRGQDRLSMPLAMLSAVLVTPGLQQWSRLLCRKSAADHREGIPRVLAGVLIIVAAAAALASLPSRSDNAAKNFALEYEGRGRFLQADELAQWEAIGDDLDPSKKVLASPFSGASHMYALHGQPAYLPVAGLSLTRQDRNVIASVPLADSSPAHCRNFADRDIGYVYQERRPYAFDPTYAQINQNADDLGPVLFETPHSRLIEIDCAS